MISVIIPTHNRCELLTRAIKSVASQTIKEDVEIIVVSDGSTDNTKKIVEGLGLQNLKFIEYFPSQNGNHARNVGLSVSSGEYVAFLDDDDEWLPTKLEKQIGFMRDAKCGMSFTLSKIIYINEKVSYVTKPTNLQDFSKLLLLKNCIGSTSTVIVEKKIIEKSGLFDEKLPALQDYDMWIRICKYTQAVCVNESLVNYYNYTNKKNSNEQVSSNVHRYEQAFEVIESKYRERFDELSSKEKKIRLKNKLILLCNKCLRNGKRGAAIKYSFKMLKHGFFKDFLKFFVCSFISYKRVLKLRSSD